MLQPIKLGPPNCIKSKPYPVMLEMIETESNKIQISEYSKEILNYYSQLELKNDINPTMIDLQPELKWFMRPFLLDFLIELHSSFKLQPQTLFLTFNIIDRYCSKRIVFKRHYQLVGCSALWIASKYEDKKSRVPTLRELSMMCRQAYDEEMFIQMERHILSTLEWDLSVPTLEDCLQLTTKNFQGMNSSNLKYNNNNDNESDSDVATLSALTAINRFLCELSLYERNFMVFPSSLISITANLISNSILQIPTASNKLFEFLNNSNSSSFFFNDENNEIEGSFLSGINNETLNHIKIITLLFMNSLMNISEVLKNKYKNFGVIKIIENFKNSNISIFNTIFSNFSMNEIIEIDFTCQSQQQQHLQAQFKFNLIFEIMLNLPYQSSSFYNQFQPTPIQNHFNLVPLTPPSASSINSIFSNGNNSSSSVLNMNVASSNTSPSIDLFSSPNSYYYSNVNLNANANPKAKSYTLNLPNTSSVTLPSLMHKIKKNNEYCSPLGVRKTSDIYY